MHEWGECDTTSRRASQSRGADASCGWQVDPDAPRAVRLDPAGGDRRRGARLHGRRLDRRGGAHSGRRGHGDRPDHDGCPAPDRRARGEPPAREPARLDLHGDGLLLRAGVRGVRVRRLRVPRAAGYARRRARRLDRDLVLVPGADLAVHAADPPLPERAPAVRPLAAASVGDPGRDRDRHRLRRSDGRIARRHRVRRDPESGRRSRRRDIDGRSAGRGRDRRDPVVRLADPPPETLLRARARAAALRGSRVRGLRRADRHRLSRYKATGRGP